MPVSTVHQALALKLKNNLNFSDEDFDLFVIGSVAPDCWRNALVDKKNHNNKKYSHFYEDGKINYKSFYNKYKDNINHPFILGYLFHLITDQYWDDNIEVLYKDEEDNIKLLDGSVFKGEKIEKKFFLFYDKKRIAKFFHLLLEIEDIFLLTDKEIGYLDTLIEEIDLSGLNKTLQFINRLNDDNNTENTLVYKGEDFVKGIDDCYTFILEELKKLKED